MESEYCSNMVAQAARDYGKLCRVLSLDGGGAKGFYTLGVLDEVEAMLGRRLYEAFDLIFGTSTGAIIAALLALGYSVDEIHETYKARVLEVVKRKTRHGKTEALTRLSDEVFGTRKFDAIKTGIGIVATRWVDEKPMIFKASIEQAHGARGTFEPGFGCTIGDAVQASCSAYPFFKKKTVMTGRGDTVLLIDGGYCANNPALYAIADATEALKFARRDIRVASIGVGVYPRPKYSLLGPTYWVNQLFTVRLLQKALEINTQSM
jgi:uncharacterized protein